MIVLEMVKLENIWIGEDGVGKDQIEKNSSKFGQANYDELIRFN